MDIYELHERCLRRLILNEREPHYIGDTVRVSSRWAGETQNPHQGKEGAVIGVTTGLQGTLNVDYMIYTVLAPGGERFETYHYALDRVQQTPTNRLLEHMLRNTSPPVPARTRSA